LYHCEVWCDCPPPWRVSGLGPGCKSRGALPLVGSLRKHAQLCLRGCVAARQKAWACMYTEEN
jgi:hypothetical protein